MTIELPENPESREESYLASIAGQDVTIPEKPLSRKEQYLAYIAENGSGGGGGGGKGGILLYTNNDPSEAVSAGTTISLYKDAKLETPAVNEDLSKVVDAEGETSVLVVLGDTVIRYSLIGAFNDFGSLLWKIEGTPSGTYLLDFGEGPTYSSATVSDSSLKIVSAPGNSSADVMSQNATTNMIFNDPSARKQVRIGNTSAVKNYGVSIGYGGSATGNAAINIGSGSASADHAVAIGADTLTSKKGSVALGYGALANRIGEVNIGCNAAQEGYNTSHYRVLGGVYDGQTLHDAATVAQGNTLATSAPTTSTAGVLGQLYTDTTGMHTYQCTAIEGNTYTWTQRW